MTAMFYSGDELYDDETTSGPIDGPRRVIGTDQADPQNDCDCEGGCIRCDDEIRADAMYDDDPYDDGRWD